MPDTPPRAETAERVDHLCDQFEVAFNRGEKPSIETFLAMAPDADRPQLLAALVGLDWELQTSRGEAPGLDDYRRRFPNDVSVIEAAWEELSRSSGMQPGRVDPRAVGTLRGQTSETSVAPTRSVPASTPSEQVPKSFGRFEIIRQLGKGAFGTVYLARDPKLDRNVALKVPQAADFNDETERQRFLREAKAAAGLSHPNICRVHEVSEADGRDFIVMEYVEGKPLDDYVTRGKIQPKQAVQVVRKLALALEEAHRNGIVHRDIKPANVMINLRGEPIIMDFGLARMQRTADVALTQSGMIMGSPAYMSPEQARGAVDEIGPAADIYSLGVVLYELISGKRPFTGTMMQVIGDIQHVEPPPPSRHRPDLDPALEQICLKAIAKQAKSRYASMKEFAAALGDYLKEPTKPAATETKVPSELTNFLASMSDTEQEQKTRRKSLQKPADDLEHSGTVRSLKKRNRPKRRAIVGPIWNWRTLAAAAGGLAVLFAGVYLAVIAFSTPYGTVVINVLDKNVAVTFANDEVTFDSSGKKYRLKTTEKKTLKLLVDGVEIESGTQEISVSKNEEKIITAKLLPDKRLELVIDSETKTFAVPGKSTGAVASVTPDSSEPPRAIAPFDAAFGWIDLFNGNDLTGWKAVPLKSTKDPGRQWWAARPQEGILESLGEDHLDLETEKTFRNFALQLEWRFTPGGKTTPNGSGVIVRTRGLTTEGPVAGFDPKGIEIDFRTNNTNNRAPNLGTGCFIAYGTPLENASGKADGVQNRHLNRLKDPVMSSSDGWNTCEITCDGDRITVSINGAKVNEAWGAEDVAGTICLRNQQSAVQYRNIRIREMNPTASRDRQAAEWALGLQLVVTVVMDETQQEIELKKLDEIPQQAFRLKGLAIDRFGRRDVTDLAPLRGCQSLQSLFLVDTNVTNEALVHLQDGANLEAISLDGTPVTDEGLRTLARHKKLRTLGLHRTNVTASGLAHLQGSSTLRDLLLPNEIDLMGKEAQSLHAALPNCWIHSDRGSLPATTDPGPAADAGSSDRRAAEWIHRYGTVSVKMIGAVREISVAKESGLPEEPFHVTGCDLSRAGFPAEEIDNLRGLEHLESVFMHSSGAVDDHGLAVLGQIPSITLLDVGANKITGEGLPALQGLKNLRHLTIMTNPGVDDQSLRHLTKLGNLSSLRIGGRSITDEGVKIISTMPQLQTLSLEGSRITGAAFDHLAKLPALTDLTADSTPLENKDAPKLAQLKSLTSLRLMGTNIGDIGLEHLHGLKNLQAINVIKTRITAPGIDKFHKAIPQCRIEWDGGVIEPGATFQAAGTPTPLKWRDHAPGVIWSMPTGPDWWHRAAISPTGNFIAAGRLTEGGKDKESVRIHLWPINDSQDGNQSFVVRHPTDGKRERNTIEGLVFARDGKILASSALDGSICLWDVGASSPKMLSRIQPYDWCVDGLDISPDGRWLATVGRTAGVPVMIWDISNPAEPREKARLAQNEKEITDTIAFSRTGQTLLLAPTVADAEARVLAWDFENGKTTRTIWKGPAPKGWIRWLRESPDGDRVGICVEEKAHVVEARTGKVLITFSGHGKFLNGFVFTPDGERCMTSSYDGTIRQWSATTGLQSWQSDQFHGVNEGLAISPDGRLVFAVSHGGGSVTDEKGNLAQLWRLPEP